MLCCQIKSGNLSAFSDVNNLLTKNVILVKHTDSINNIQFEMVAVSVCFHYKAESPPIANTLFCSVLD